MRKMGEVLVNIQIAIKYVFDSTTYTVSFIFLINKIFSFLLNFSEETEDFPPLPYTVR